MDTLKTCLYEHLYKYDVIACFLGATSSDQPNLWLQQVGPLFLPEWPGIAHVLSAGMLQHLPEPCGQLGADL